MNVFKGQNLPKNFTLFSADNGSGGAFKPLLRVGDMQTFAEGDGGAGDGGQSGAGDGGAAGGQAGGQGAGASGGQAGGQQPFAIFPDEQSFMSRVNREGKKQVNEFLKGLGVEKAEDLQAILKAHNDNIEAQKTELQKAQDAAKAAQDAQAAALAQASNVIRTAEAKVQALAAGVKPERIDYLLKLTDLSKIEVKDGAVDSALVKEAIENVLKDLPELKAQPGTQKAGGDFSGGGQNTGLTMDQIKTMTPAEMEARLDEVMKFMATQK